MTPEELEAFRERARSRREGSSNGEEGEDNSKESRIGNNRWCFCGRCVAIPTTKESICCKEIREASDKMTQNEATYQLFERVCRDPDVLQTALVLVSNVRFHQYSQPIQVKLTVWQLTDNSRTGFTVD